MWPEKTENRRGASHFSRGQHRYASHWFVGIWPGPVPLHGVALRFSVPAEPCANRAAAAVCCEARCPAPQCCSGAVQAALPAASRQLPLMLLLLLRPLLLLLLLLLLAVTGTSVVSITNRRENGPE